MLKTLKISVFLLLSGVLFSLPSVYSETLLKVNAGHFDSISCIDFFPDGKILAIGSNDGSIKLWEVSTGRELYTLSCEDTLMVSALHAGEKTITALLKDPYFGGGDGRLFVYTWDLNTLTSSRRLIVTDPEIWSKGMNASGNTGWYFSGNTYKGSIFNTANGNILTFDLNIAAVSPSGRFIVLFNSEGLGEGELPVYRIYDTVAKNWSLLPPTESEPGIFVFTDDEKFLLTDLETGGLSLLDMDGYETVARYTGYEGSVFSASFSPDGSSLYAFSKHESRNETGVFHTWSIYSDQPVSAVRDISLNSFTLDYTGNRGSGSSGVLMACYTGNGTISLYNPETGQRIRSFGTPWPPVVQLSGDLGGGDYLSLHTTVDGQGSIVRLHRNFGNSLKDVYTSSDEKILSVTRLEKSHQYVINLTKEVRFLGEYTLTVNKSVTRERSCIAGFSPDEKYYVLALYDFKNTVLELHDLQSHRLLKSIELDKNYSPRELFFSCDNRFIFIGGNYQIVKVDILSGNIAGLTEYDNFLWNRSFDIDYDNNLLFYGSGIFGPVYSDRSRLGAVNLDTMEKTLFTEKWPDYLGKQKLFAVTADSARGVVYSGGSDAIIKGWDMVSGAEVASFTGGHNAPVMGLQISEDGRMLVSAAYDGSFVTRDLTTGKIVVQQIVSSDGEWVSWTPDGYYTGSEWGVRNMVHIVDGFTTYSIDQFFEKFYRPDIVTARLKGQDTNFLTEGTITDGFAPPPSVSLSILNVSGQFIKPEGDLTLYEPGGNRRPAGQWALDGESITVRVSAQDAGGGIDGFRLFSGGRAVGEDTRGLKSGAAQRSLSRDFIVPLARGDNRLRAVGFSRDRIESAPAELMITWNPGDDRQPNLYGLIIAADTYRNSRYNLNYAIADARGVKEALDEAAGGLFGQVRLTTLYNSMVTRSNIESALEKIAGMSAPDDVFILFYAGHGIAAEDEGSSRFYFVLPLVTQMTGEKIRDLGLSSEKLRRLMSGIPASKQLVLVDACNSGAFAEGFAIRGAAEELALRQLARSSGSVIMTASREDQFASEIAELGHGVFTWALIRGLKGEASTRDGRITASSLRTWVDNEVPLLSERYKGSVQFPTTFMYGQDFPIGIRH